MICCYYQVSRRFPKQACDYWLSILKLVPYSRKKTEEKPLEGRCGTNFSTRKTCLH
jgi:hypothetical protein